MLVLLDRALFAFHAALIAFNLTGWIWARTRRAHRIAVGLTAFSWFAMGATRGWGYCLCTDWHFRVRRALGYPVAESSFIQLLARSVGVTLGRDSSNRLAAGTFAAIVVATAVTWNRERRARGRSARS